MGNRTGSAATVGFSVIVAAGVLAGCGMGEPAGAPGPTLEVSATALPYEVKKPHVGDGLPNHADNRRWRERRDLTPADRAVAEKAAAKILAALEPLRDKGERSSDAITTAIEAAGFPPDSISIADVPPAGAAYDAPPIGSSFGVSVGQAGCVIGALMPDKLSAEPAGSAVEFGCLEPRSH